MSDDDGLGKALDELRQRASRSSWRPAPPAYFELRVFTNETHEAVPTGSVADLVTYARTTLGTEMRLGGGGFGCFEMLFVGAAADAAAWDDAIRNDLNLAAILNRMCAHHVGVKCGDQTATFAAFHNLVMLVATTREKATPKVDAVEGVQGSFGQRRSAVAHYAAVDLDVLDLASGTERESFLKRVWKRATLGAGELREKAVRVIVRRIDPIADEKAFRLLASARRERKLLLSIHGYANTFDDALKSSALTAYKTRLDQTDHLPILFSWPAAGPKVGYLSDTRMAEDAELPLGRLLKLLGGLGEGQLDVLAHSHGAKILARTAYSIAEAGGALSLDKLIFVEPDVDQQFLEDRIEKIATLANATVVYHTLDDLALRFAEKVFGGVRAGTGGLPSCSIVSIDASAVAKGLVRHAPHVDCREVIADLNGLLMGRPPERRFNLRRVDKAAGRWMLSR